MIALTSTEGRWLKTLADQEETYLYHPQFGFITEAQLEERANRRERFGLRTNPDEIRCRFRVVSKDGKISASDLVDCEATSLDSGVELKTGFGRFKLIPAKGIVAPIVPEKGDSESRKIWKTSLVLMLLSGGALILGRGHPTAPTEPEVLTPIKVTMIPEVVKQKAVTVPANDFATKLKVQDQQTRRAVQQNLGFLGLIGKKDLSKALGGMPSTLKEASAGAGAGGKEGSGGEYLVGLGQGVRRATVGNTGVAGLGGIGTKGAGGGAGGYGNSMVGSGEGKSLSKVALSNELTLEGGLDRAVIQATIAKYLSQVRACYEEQLQNNPGLAGQVTMAFTINGNGAVTASQVARTTLGNTAAENCIATRMKSWNFPKPVGGVNVKVNYPFLLRPAGA